jgi:hypothetical protein
MSLLEKLIGRDKTTLPSHTRGIRMGNQPGSYEKQAGNLPDGKVTAAKSTGINAADREPIDPRMPTLPPP